MMKKLIFALLAVLLLTGCTQKTQEPNGIVEAVVAGYETVNQTEDNAVRVMDGENQAGIVQVDQISETNTLMRPYILIETGVDFYKIEHSEKSFLSFFRQTLNLLAEMQNYDKYKESTRLMDETKLPEGLEPSQAGFLSMGYVPDPQRKCEIMFVGMTSTGEGEPIRDEVYAFCRFPMQDSSNTPMIMNVLVADQHAVYGIAQKVHPTGKLPSGVEAWMRRRLGL